MAADLTPPDCLKAMKPYMLIAKQHDNRDKVVAYFCRRYAMETALKEGSIKSPEDKSFLLSLMDKLEQDKKELGHLETFANELVAQAHVENYALKIFLYADNEDREGRFSTNLVKIFYKAGLLLDVCQTFGDLTEEVQAQKKYAKYKASNISACLKRGETPKAGPPGEEFEGGALFPGSSNQAGAMGGSNYTTPYPPANQPEAFYPPAQPPPSVYPPPQHPPSYPQGNSYPPPQQPPPIQHTPTSQIQPGAFAPPSTPDQPPAAAASSSKLLNRPGSIQFSAEDYIKATKFCKYAISALQYEDVPTAISNLQDALKLLKTGQL